MLAGSAGPGNTPAGAEGGRRGQDDADLVEGLVARRPAAQGAVLRKFGPLVRRTLERSLGVGPEIEDVAQEVFLRLFRKVAGIKNPRSLRHFVIGIAVRTASEEVRRRSRRRRYEPHSREWWGLSAAPPTRRRTRPCGTSARSSSG